MIVKFEELIGRTDHRSLSNKNEIFGLMMIKKGKKRTIMRGERKDGVSELII